MSVDFGLPDTYTLIGAGRLATALALELGTRNIRPGLVASRTRSSAEALAALAGGPAALALDDLTTVPNDLVLICVSDDAVADVASLLAGSGSAWRGRTVLHTSGALGSDALTELAASGASTGSMHPLQTFATLTVNEQTAEGDRPNNPFENVPMSVEGSDRAVETATALAQELGGWAVRVDPDKKILLHIAAVVASNYATTLLSIANDLAGRAGLSSTAGESVFNVLVRQAVENAVDQGPETGLTGPIVRGDIDIVRRHLKHLRTEAPDVFAVYAALATETVRLASRSGRLPNEMAEAILDELNVQLTLFQPDPDGTSIP